MDGEMTDTCEVLNGSGNRGLQMNAFDSKSVVAGRGRDRVHPWVDLLSMLRMIPGFEAFVDDDDQLDAWTQSRELRN